MTSSVDLKVYAISKEPSSRIFDVIVYGATGYTGKEIAKYICRTSSEKTKWAIAGRSQGKLGQLKSQLLSIGGGNLPDILVSDADDTRTLQAMFAETRLVLNCTGPFRFLGKQVVEACLVVRADYMDICGEPQFMESCFLDYHAMAVEKRVLIIHACAFDSVPADLGCLYTLRQFPLDSCTQIESFLHIKCPKGLKAHYTTFECAVHGVGDAASLKEIRKKIDEKYKPAKLSHNGPKLVRNTGSYFDKRVNKYAIPFMGADAAVVRSSQRSQSLRSGQSTFPQYAAYACLNSMYWVATAGFYGAIFQTLSSFEAGRSLLLACPETLSAGVFSKDGPSKAQLEQTSFEMHFYALGYSTVCTPDGNGESTGHPPSSTEPRMKGGKHVLSPDQVAVTSSETKTCDYFGFSAAVRAGKDNGAVRGTRGVPDRRVHTIVTGQEPGYVATPAIFVTLAKSLLESRSLMPAGGVLTPASAWVGVDDVFERLHSAGIVFKVVGTNWDEGIKKSQVMAEREVEHEEGSRFEESGEKAAAREGEKDVPMEADACPVVAQRLC